MKLPLALLTVIAAQNSVVTSAFSLSPSLLNKGAISSTSTIIKVQSDAWTEVVRQRAAEKAARQAAKIGKLAPVNPVSESDVNLDSSSSSIIDNIQSSTTTPVDIPVPVPSIDDTVTTVTYPDVIPSIPDFSPSAQSSSQQALEDAANQAIDAAEKASQAAASIAVPSLKVKATSAAAVKAAFTAPAASKATATAAAAGTASSSVKAPTLYEMLTNTGPPPISSNINVDEIVQKFNSMKDNIDYNGAVHDMDDLIRKFGVDVKSAVESMTTITKTAATAGAGAGAAISISPSLENMPTFNELLTILKVNEYGSWYVSASAILFALTQREAGRQDAQAEFEVELTEAKARAEEAANAAKVAAEGARLAKELAKKSQFLEASNSEKKSDSLLESKTKMLEVEKEMMQKQMVNLQEETKQLRDQIAMIINQKSQEQFAQSEPNVVSVAPSIKVTKITMERDPDEDSRILSVLKTIDQENKKKAKPTATTTTTTTTKKKRKVVKKSETVDTKPSTIDISIPYDAAAKLAYESTNKKMTYADFKLKYEQDTVAMIKAKQKLGEKVDATPTPPVVADAVTTPKPTSVKKTRTVAKAVKPKKTTQVKESTSAPAKKKTKLDASEILKAMKDLENDTKETISSSLPPPSSADENPWGSLKESTLKRKTVAELKAYLVDKMVDVNGMTKADMVEKVYTL